MLVPGVWAKGTAAGTREINQHPGADGPRPALPAVPAKLLSRSPAHQSSCCFESRSLALEAAHCRTDRTEDPGRAPQNVVV